jgi:flagellar biosynthesis protein FlhF
MPSGSPRPLLLAGPPGAGKTLSCAKLAARATLAGAPPLVISTDSVRAGAAEQLAAFTRLLGLTLALAATPGALGKAIGRRGAAAGAATVAAAAATQPVLIDTAGCDPFNASEAALLHSLAAASAAEIVLVLPGGLDPAEAAELAQAFARLGARHLLPTRLDLTRRLGGVLAAAAAGLALTEGGIGPNPADGLRPIDPDWLAERLLTPPGGPSAAPGEALPMAGAF